MSKPGCVVSIAPCLNRLVTDSIADLLLVSEEGGLENLRREGIPGHRVDFIGNLMIDSLHHNLARARNSSTPQRLGIDGGRFGIVTLHRTANVDDPARFAQIIAALNEIATEVPLYFPVHPRTRTKLENVPLTGIRLLEPLGYIDFLSIMCHSAVVLTDSGGIQEETTALGIPCLTVRENTERPITIEQGTNRLAGTDRDSILSAWRELKDNPKTGQIPKYWDGKAAERAVQSINRFFSIPSMHSQAPAADVTTAGPAA